MEGLEKMVHKERPGVLSLTLLALGLAACSSATTPAPALETSVQLPREDLPGPRGGDAEVAGGGREVTDMDVLVPEDLEPPDGAFVDLSEDGGGPGDAGEPDVLTEDLAQDTGGPECVADPAGESCNGLDDDCDDLVDEGLSDFDCGTPKIVSEPGTSISLSEALGSEFNLDEAFIASSRTDEVRVYNMETLDYLQSFTHPSFSEIDSPSYAYGPNGMAFNERRNLVVAAYSAFVEFSSYGVEYALYPKMAPEPTENVIFDSLGNMYTTTSTGGSDKLNKYSAEDYAFEMTIEMPPGAGQLTGITFDFYNRLFVASQSDNSIHVFEFNWDFTEFSWLKALSGQGNPKSFEGLQIAPNGEVLAAAGDIIRYDYESGQKLGMFDAPNDMFPVPLTVDNSGRIYTSDYENGSGTAPADIFRFTPDGAEYITINDPDLFGPFGLAISGTILPGEPPVLYSYQVEALDIDGDDLAYSLLMHPDGMFIEPDTGLIQWYITCAQMGTWEVVVKVEDPQGQFVIQEFLLEVK